MNGIWSDCKEQIMRSLPRDCAIVFHCPDHGTRAFRRMTAVEAIYRAAQLRGRVRVVADWTARGLQPCPS